MKKIEGKENFKFIEGKRLYLNDLNKIINILENKKYSIEIKNDNYEFSSIDDVIKNLGLSPDCLSVEGSFTPKKSHFSNWIYIGFNKSKIHLYINKETVENVFLFSEIDELLESCESIEKNKEKDINSLILTNKMMESEKRIVIENKIETKMDEKGFWKKNKEKILLIILGSILTFFFQIMFKLIFKK